MIAILEPKKGAAKKQRGFASVHSPRQIDTPVTFWEFFAGGGMARLALESLPGWKCTFANEWCEKKAATYQRHFGPDSVTVADVASLSASQVDGAPDFVWASFPCQDLSLAGNGAGLEGERSGTFHSFWRLMRELVAENRAPRVLAMENVVGTLTVRDGKDFISVCEALAAEGYRVGALVVDAVDFLPHSRPRLFWIATRSIVPPQLALQEPDPARHPASLQRALSAHASDRLKSSWVWWSLPAPHQSRKALSDLLEKDPKPGLWHSQEETLRLIGQMSETQRQKLAAVQMLKRRMVGCAYRRTRKKPDGGRGATTEVRFDGLSGCLRTPTGGSSRQFIFDVDGTKVRSRLMSPKEAARLMGLPESYPLPDNYNHAYHLAADGVAIPVVRFLAKNLISKLVTA